MSDWTTRPLSEVLHHREGPGIMARDFREEGVPLIRLAGLKRGAHILDGANYLDPATVEKRWGQFRVLEGDTLLSTSASLGEVARVSAEGVGAVPYTGIITFRPRDDRIDPDFVQHMLKAPSFADQVAAMGVGSVLQHFGPSHLRQMKVSFPGREAQRAISDVLGALDDKIAANTRVGILVNELLSVRFAQLSAGRSTTTLRSLAGLNERKAVPQEGTKLRYLDISSISQGGYEFPLESEWEDAPGRARRAICRGDVVWSTVRPNRRSHALVLDDDKTLVGSTGLAVLTPRPGRMAVLYEATRTERFVAFLESVAEGSAYPAVRAERFLDAPVPDLRPHDLDEFEQFALPLRELVHAATVESRRLTAMRDELLPLLMSGRAKLGAVVPRAEALR